MVFLLEKQANIIDNFGRLHINDTLTCAQKVNLTAHYGGICVNWSVSQVKNMDAVKTILSPSEGNINPGYPQGMNIYLEETKDIYK